MWECTCVNRMCSTPLMIGINLMWLPVMSFVRECWQLLLWQEVQLLTEEFEPDRGVRQDLLSARWPSLPVRLGVFSQVAGIEYLKVWLKLAPVPSTVCFSFSPHWDLCTKGGHCWSRAGVLTEAQCSACVGIWGSAQMYTWCIFSPVATTLDLVLDYGMQWAGPEHSLGLDWGPLSSMPGGKPTPAHSSGVESRLL